MNDSKVASGVEWTLASSPPRLAGIPTVRLDAASITRRTAPLGYRGIAARRKVASTTRECVKPPCGGSRFTPVFRIAEGPVHAQPPHALRRVQEDLPILPREWTVTS